MISLLMTTKFVKIKDVKHVVAGLLVQILLPVAAQIKRETNIPALITFVGKLYGPTNELASKKQHKLDVDPIYTIWEDQQCPLREDILEEPLTSKQVPSNASVTRDNCFVSPPASSNGNVPLEEATPLDQNLISQWDKLGMEEVAPTPKQYKREEND